MLYLIPSKGEPGFLTHILVPVYESENELDTDAVFRSLLFENERWMQRSSLHWNSEKSHLAYGRVKEKKTKQRNQGLK